MNVREMAHIYKKQWQYILGHPIRFDVSENKRELEPRIIWSTSVVKVEKNILQPLFEKELLAFERIYFVDEMLKTLNYQEFVAISYRYWMGYPQKLIAKKHSVTRKSVFRWEQYAQEKIRKYITKNKQKFNILFLTEIP